MEITEKSKELLKNCHTTLKWMWIIVMALAVKKAVENFVYCVDPATGTQILRGWRHLYLQDILVFTTFITTIVRFYQGDSRYLDRTYLESCLDLDPEYYFARNRFFDFYLLLFHAILFYALAASERQFLSFFYIYSTIILFNAIWLGVVYLRAPDKKRVLYPRNWSINNFFHFCLLIVLYFFTNGLKADYAYIIFFILASSNTFVDYLTTWS